MIPEARMNMEQNGIKEFKQDDLDYLRTSNSSKIANIYNMNWNRLENINMK